MTQQEILRELPRALVPWFRRNARSMPWRQDKEPYHVWLSEIMLQQTRIEAAKDYYIRFLRELPDVQALAAADPERLDKLWEGLGYYSRVHNMQAAAQQLMEQYGGSFPRSSAELQQLKGIGEYTAGAIASICFEQPEPAVDGNVLRVLSRLTLDSRPVDDPPVRRELALALREVYPAGSCGDFTQALMELGETICLPNGEPTCERCPVRELCGACGTEASRTLPVRTAKKPRRTENMTVFVLSCDGCTAVRKRSASGLLAGLWELPHVPGHLTQEQALAQTELWCAKPVELLRQNRQTHIFTHVQWEMQCYYLRCRAMPDGFVWAPMQELITKYALPTAFRRFLAERK